MSEVNNGGPAFPMASEAIRQSLSVIDCLPEGDQKERISEQFGERLQGMSIRDYFAAAALQGMLCNGFIPRCALPDGPVIQTYDYPAVAYTLADQMLEARK